MLKIDIGKPIGMIKGGYNDGRLICIYEKKTEEETDTGVHEIDLLEGKIKPLMNYEERGVYYIAGPSGSGKSTYAINLIKDYIKMYPKSDFFLFSRTSYKNDPVFNGMKISQIKIDESLLEKPIDIEKELNENSILFFDDCNTVQNIALKNYLDRLMGDVMEVGRRLKINIIITNHLVLPQEMKIKRTIMNEVQYLTIFPQSGSSQQITYALKTYFGLNRRQINKILELSSRWVTIIKHYPMSVIYEKGVYIL
jgi:hypothetical protein